MKAPDFAQTLYDLAEEGLQFERCMNLYVDKENSEVVLLLDTSRSHYCDERPGYTLLRSGEGDGLVGVRLPLLCARLAVHHEGELRINEGFLQPEEEDPDAILASEAIVGTFYHDSGGELIRFVGRDGRGHLRFMYAGGDADTFDPLENVYRAEGVHTFCDFCDDREAIERLRASLPTEIPSGDDGAYYVDLARILDLASEALQTPAGES